MSIISHAQGVPWAQLVLGASCVVVGLTGAAVRLFQVLVAVAVYHD